MEFPVFSPVFVGVFFLRRETKAAFCSSVYSLGFRFGFTPSLNGYSEHFSAVQSFTSSALIQAIDRHISGMTESEKEMALRFIYALEDLREAQA